MSTEEEPHPDISIARLEKAWKCIIEEQLPRSQEASLQTGPGISIFAFRRPAPDQTHNCDFCYAEKDTPTWDMILNASPLKKEIETAYNSSENHLICVSVPCEGSDEHVQTVKLFKLGTNVAIEF